MDIVLGVSMTPTTVRMVLVEGELADGVTVDHDVFDITTAEGSATSADQVIGAVLGTRESAESGGHHLKSVGVTWSDHGEAAALRDALADRGIEDVMLVSEGHAAGALAQAVGRAVGYDTTALLFIDRDNATLSVVQTEDGSVVKVLSRSLHSSDAMAVLADMASAVDAQESAPQAMFVVGSGVDVSSVKSHLEHLVSIPVNAPDEPELALARGAALASAHAPALEASTVGLAYSQDPDDGTTAGGAYARLAAADTQLAPAGDDIAALDAFDSLEPGTAPAAEEGRKPFLLVGSALTSIFVVGVVALVISLAVSIRPTADQRPSPAQSAVAPSAPVQAPPPVPEAAPPAPPPAAPAAPPPAETIKAPIPVVQKEPEAPAPQAPPRTVFVEKPAPAPEAPAPAPEAPPPAPVPEAPPPAPEPVAPAPVIAPPIVLPPPVVPIWRPPWEPPRREQPSWRPPWEPPQREEPSYPKFPSRDNDGPSWLPGSGSGSGGGRSDYPGSGRSDWDNSGRPDWGGGSSGSGGSGGSGPFGGSGGSGPFGGSDSGPFGGSGGSGRSGGGSGPMWPFGGH